MAFELASTNMVAELSIILVILMGWQFAVAEFAGAPLMVLILAFLFRGFLSPRLVESARTQANKGIRGVMEGHADMDMSVRFVREVFDVIARGVFTSVADLARKLRNYIRSEGAVPPDSAGFQRRSGLRGMCAAGCRVVFRSEICRVHPRELSSCRSSHQGALGLVSPL
jgi:predicted permease